MSKIWIAEEIEKIFEDIKRFAVEFEDNSSFSDEDKEQKVYVFIGDSAYPQNRAVNPSIIPPFNFYSNFNFSEVAFLSSTRTLEMYSILGIMFDSIDGAAQLIGLLLQNNLMNVFAKYLWYKKRVLLVNAENQKKQIDCFLSQYLNYNVYLCCGKKHKLKSFTALSNSKTKQHRHFNFLIANHPSPRSYQTGFNKNCQCYMDRTYSDHLSNLTLQNFVIF